MKKIILSIAIITLVLTAGHASALIYQPLDFSADFTGRIQTGGLIGINESNLVLLGDVILGGVDFYVPATGSNYWNSYNAGGTNPITLEISVGLYGVSEVHTLINTYWGRYDQNLASIEFFGSDGAYYKYELIGGVDIRDYYNGAYTNTITSPNTTEVWTNNAGSPSRLDKQVFYLPSEFLTEELVSITLSDYGSTGNQRIFLTGITAGYDDSSAVPIPGAVWLLGSGLVGLVGLRRKMKSCLLNISY